MNTFSRPEGLSHTRTPLNAHLATTWIELILVGVVWVRSLLFYRDQPALPAVILLLTTFSLLYFLAPLLTARFRRFPFLYYFLQTAALVALSRQQPFLDFTQILYVGLGLQVLRAFNFKSVAVWLSYFALCLNVTIVLASGWLEGLAFSLLVTAAFAFMISYDQLSSRMQSDRDASQRLLDELQTAHEKLKEHAGRAEELAAARERNRLARELHDSVSQSIFAIRLTSLTARALLERDKARVPEQLGHLQEMSAAALGQLRSLIARLHPPALG